MTKQSFIKGTMILLAAGMINRILGFIPRITLPRVIGPEGVGLYQMGYPFLILILTFITGGIPIAVAKLVAEAEAEANEARVRRIFRTALLLSCALGLFFTALSYLGAGWITRHFFTDQRVYYTFLCMNPIIFFVSISAVFAGLLPGTPEHDSHSHVPGSRDTFSDHLRSDIILPNASIRAGVCQRRSHGRRSDRRDLCTSCLGLPL